jgi:signal transduction histidine kinase
VEEMTRFNEAIDQILSESVARYAALVEDTLRQESANNDRFLAILSHELRNLLNAIVAASALLDSGGDKDQARYVLKRQIGHLKRLLDDLLDLSRIAFNRISLQTKSVDLHPCIDDALAAVAELVKCKSQTLSVRLPNEPVVIEADCTRVTQVVANLLSNAAKYSPAGSRIGVAVRHEVHEVEIAVRDNGPGIGSDELAHLFRPFHDPAKLLTSASPVNPENLQITIRC